MMTAVLGGQSRVDRREWPCLVGSRKGGYERECVCVYDGRLMVVVRKGVEVDMVE
jgi:hypothetical protein